MPRTVTTTPGSDAAAAFGTDTAVCQDAVVAAAVAVADVADEAGYPSGDRTLDVFAGLDHPLGQS
jgi:hypothetical protein